MRASGFAFALASTLLCAPVRAEPPRQPGAGELRAALERLLVVGNVLYVAAHPDDENTRLLAYLVGAEKVRAAYLSLTRGDGGQNLVGAEQGPLLGLIRTQELLAARRVDGAEQLFTRAIDFGYSKRADETLAIWSRDEVLADVVWAIRRFRPDVVITRFPPDGGDTHGHHTASALLAVQAFALAGDPQYRPDQVARVGAWKPRRIVWNRGRWNPDPKEDMSGFLSLDIGGYDPLLGASWGEIAADSRSMHKSQGFGAARTRGPQLEYFKSLGGEPIKASLFDGVDRTWMRVASSGELRRLLADARNRFDGAHPEAVVPGLVKAYGVLEGMPDFPWKAAKTRELAEVIAACAGLWIGLEAKEPTAVAGRPLRLSLEVLERAPAGLVLERVQVEGGPAIAPAHALEPGKPWSQAVEVPVPAEHRGTSPYWLDEPPAQGLYTVRDVAQVGDPEGPPAAAAELTFRLGAQRFSLRRAAAHRWVDPVAGERYRPIEIVPPVVVNPARAVLLSPSGAPAELRVRVKAGDKAQAGVVRPEAPSGWTVEPKERAFSLATAGAEAELAFRVTPPASPATTEGTLRVVAHAGGRTFDRGLVRVEHAHIPVQTLLPRADVRVVKFPLRLGRARLGYIPGAGDQVAAALEQAGYRVTILDDATLESRPLDGLDAIVVGVRAYNVNKRLPLLHGKLMKWVEGGGVLVAQYTTQNRLSQAPPEIGPYPMSLSQERVTDERAEVKLSDHVVLQKPNALSKSDFDGWVQERGLYFASKWDAHYETPLEMHDPGEPGRKGGLLVAPYGKGRFVYTGLAFFRQLPAGVPGAFRLFANLLSLPGARGRR